MGGGPLVFRDGWALMGGPVTVAEVAQRFGVPCWLGAHTGTYWALVRGGRGWRLVEAMSARELAEAITTPDGWPWP